ncbi:MAG: hypothetical protein US76_04100 [Parcubacteria group bacterium GW2011_GWA2_38_13b]|nr:MAG: hypothetical protein US76_04100 [Parcubacteria group bacterium GW2011_GWA2_38_13b]
MSFDAILQKIKTDAEAEIKTAHKNKQKQLVEFSKKVKRELISLSRGFEEGLAKKKEKFLENARNDADFRAKNEILREKQKIIDEIYEKTAQKIINSPSEYYSDLMAYLIEKLPQNNNGQIYCAEKDKKIISDMLKKNDFSHEIKSEKFNERSGFIFKTKTIDIDNTVGAIMRQIKEKTIVEIGKILFK